MPRLMGVDIPGKKRIDIALTSIYGIGRTLAVEVCEKLNIDVATPARDLTETQIGEIVRLFQKDYMVEGDLRRSIAQDIRRLTATGSYRGSRHRRSLPCRGQRTKTNARTRKGGKRTVGAIRDKSARKLANKD